MIRTGSRRITQEKDVVAEMEKEKEVGRQSLGNRWPCRASGELDGCVLKAKTRDKLHALRYPNGAICQIARPLSFPASRF